ncbi:MAG TPA: LysE family transporter [Candidatus Babeliales bacterium]|nr:LysE family transporter [Candidatus Babeliales bacterium]
MIISSLFLRGFIIGILIAVPVGPIGILCMRRTLLYGYISGLASGFGAATADSFYAIVAAFGLTFISDFFLLYHQYLRILGGFIIALFGLRTIRIKSQPVNLTATHTNIFGDYFSTLMLTLTNPLTLGVFATLFASFGLGDEQLSLFKSLRLIIGVFVGSALWWLFLSTGMSIARAKIHASFLYQLHKLSGLILLVVGIFLFGSGIIRMFF